MHLVEPEEVGPIEGDDPRVTPPRPPHRRVSVSLLFTLSVLIGVVVTIYLVLPARHNVLLTEAIERHHDTSVTWDLDAPTMPELRAWSIGVVGKDAPLPSEATKVIGARRISVLRRDAALMQVEVGDTKVTYVVAKRGMAPGHNEQQDGDVRAIAWRRGKFTCIAVGPQASVSTWLAAFKP